MAATYTIDELAAASGVASRTIRYYQTEGALPPPERSGRVALYDERHLERLKVIAELQDRGLRLSAIADLLRRQDSGRLSVGEWLGVGERLQPWSEDRPRLLTDDEVAALLDRRPAGTLAALVDAGILQRQDGLPTSYLVASPALLDIALELQDAGVDLDTAARARDILDRRLGQAADELVAWFSERMEKGAARGRDLEELPAVLDALRPQALKAVEVMFAHQVERAIQQLVESGGRVTPRPRPRPRQRRQSRGRR